MTRTLTIDRSKWRRGGSDRDTIQGTTALLNHRGFMCCLGFDAIACGVPEAAIMGVGEPIDVLTSGYDIPGRYKANTRFPGITPHTTEFVDYDEGEQHRIYDQSATILDAMSFNDDPAIEDSERESLIRETLMKLGWADVVFVGQYPSDQPEQPALEGV